MSISDQDLFSTIASMSARDFARMRVENQKALKPGMKIPSISPHVDSLFPGKLVVLLTVPGIWSAKLEESGLVDILKQEKDFVNAAVENIIVVAVNTLAVVNKWAELYENKKLEVFCIADPGADFVTKLGAGKVDKEYQATAAKKVQLIVHNGIVQSVHTTGNVQELLQAVQKAHQTYSGAQNGLKKEEKKS